MKQIIYAGLFVIGLLILPSCGDGRTSQVLSPTSMTSTVTPPASILSPVTPPTSAVPTVTPPSYIDYLGQQPPGMEPGIFAPGIVSDPDFTEYSGVFSPDGTEYYFNRFSEGSQSRLMFTKVVDGKWTIPEQLEFTSEYGAYEPHVTFDNQRLYFMWQHPPPAGQPALPTYYFVERTQDGWSEPQYAGQGMFLSSSQDGQLYTTDMSSRSINGRTYLANITTVDGIFVDYERLPIQVPWGNPAHPCIAPDGRYLLFDVGSGNYLFVSFKEADGSWGEPIDLTEHGFDPMAGGAYVSPDGKFLFFSLRNDIWWVDIGIIDALKPITQ